MAPPWSASRSAGSCETAAATERCAIAPAARCHLHPGRRGRPGDDPGPDAAGATRLSPASPGRRTSRSSRSRRRTRRSKARRHRPAGPASTGTTRRRSSRTSGTRPTSAAPAPTRRRSAGSSTTSTSSHRTPSRTRCSTRATSARPSVAGRSSTSRPAPARRSCTTSSTEAGAAIPVAGEISVYFPLIGGPTRDEVTLVKFNYDSAGGGRTSVTQLDWNGSTWVETPLAPTTAFNSSVNSAGSPVVR